MGSSTVKYVVVMFEPALKGENLTLSEQVNEVFGTFDTEKEAEVWTQHTLDLIKNRQWLIIPLSNPSDLTLKLFDPTLN